VAFVASGGGQCGALTVSVKVLVYTETVPDHLRKERSDFDWWRRRFRDSEGNSVVVAKSLGERDPDIARRLGRALDAEADIMTSDPTLTAEETAEVISGVLLLQKHQMHARVRQDIKNAEKRDKAKRDEFFESRVRMCRIFAGLNRVAAHFGPLGQYHFAIDDFLVEGGFEPHERAEIRRRIDNGFLLEAYVGKSSIAGTPGEEFLEEKIKEQGRHPSALNISRCYTNLARQRSLLEAKTAQMYRAAMRGPSHVESQLLPDLPILNSDGDPWSPSRSYATADALERGDFAVIVQNEGITIVPGGLRHSSTDSQSEVARQI
jgi:hypothetical protein